MSFQILQMTDLKKYNSQLFKELNVTKSYVENMTAKLMQCKHCTSSDYQPGMLSGTDNLEYNIIFIIRVFLYKTNTLLYL